MLHVVSEAKAPPRVFTPLRAHKDVLVKPVLRHFNVWMRAA